MHGRINVSNACYLVPAIGICRGCQISIMHDLKSLLKSKATLSGERCGYDLVSTHASFFYFSYLGNWSVNPFSQNY